MVASRCVHSWCAWAFCNAAYVSFCLATQRRPDANSPIMSKFRKAVDICVCVIVLLLEYILSVRCVAGNDALDDVMLCMTTINKDHT